MTIPLLGLSISIEFAFSDSSKTVPRASCKLQVKSWLRLDNLTDFYCWLFFVLTFTFHFSIFILPIPLKYHFVLVMLKEWRFLCPEIFSPEVLKI